MRWLASGPGLILGLILLGFLILELYDRLVGRLPGLQKQRKPGGGRTWLSEALDALYGLFV